MFYRTAITTPEFTGLLAGPDRPQGRHAALAPDASDPS